MHHLTPLKAFATVIAFATVCLVLLFSTLIASAAPDQPATQPGPAVAVEAGFNHRCALTSAGGVWCWGANYYGQIGNGTLEASNAPTLVVGMESGVTQVSAGSSFTCAIQNGAVKCWGGNSDGQLGSGNFADSRVPTDVVGLPEGIVDLATTAATSCAVDAAGKVWCWGDNLHSELGLNIGEVYYSNVPISMTAITTPVIGLAAGQQHLCALTADHDLLCWGANQYGQTGSGQRTYLQWPPVIVPSLEGQVSAAAGGDAHTCAITNNGGAWCWGRGDFGQLGDGKEALHLSPAAVKDMSSGATAISAATDISCAVQNDVVKCWGVNWSSGRLGNGEQYDMVNVPTTVVSLTNDFSGVTNGEAETCALEQTGKIYCWGDNSDSLLGTGDPTTPLLAPQTVIGFGQVISDSLLYLPTIKGEVTQ